MGGQEAIYILLSRIHLQVILGDPWINESDRRREGSGKGGDIEREKERSIERERSLETEYYRT
jgi:hypothetical protein